MNKTTEALKLAEEALVKLCNAAEMNTLDVGMLRSACSKGDKALAAIREALADHSGDANEMVECPVCRGTRQMRQHFTESERKIIEDAFDAAIKKSPTLTKEFGRCKDELLAEPVKQADESLVDEWYPLQEPMNRPPNCGTGYCSCIECPYESVKQEPVAFEEWWKETGQETLYALNTLTDADAKILAKIAWESASTQPVKQEPVEYMFNVEVEGKANAVFDTADEAVRFSMHHVYLSSGKTQEAIDTLNQGQVFQYGYEFAGVNIVPVAKRKIAAPVDDYDASHLKAIRDALANARAEALEEAAKECDVWSKVKPFSDFSHGCAVGAKGCAAAIRGLIK